MRGAAAERNRLPTPKNHPAPAANMTMGYCGVRETNSQQGTVKGESTFTMPSVLVAGELRWRGFDGNSGAIVGRTPWFLSPVPWLLCPLLSNGTSISPSLALLALPVCTKYRARTVPTQGRCCIRYWG